MGEIEALARGSELNTARCDIERLKAELAAATATERDRCARIVCKWCAEDWPLVKDGQHHQNPKTRGWQRWPRQYEPCAAQGILSGEEP